MAIPMTQKRMSHTPASKTSAPQPTPGYPPSARPSDAFAAAYRASAAMVGWSASGFSRKR